MVAKRKPRNNKNKIGKKAATKSTLDSNLEKSQSKLSKGRQLQGVASLTEAFSFGIEAITQADAIRAKGKFQEAELIASAEELDRASAEAKELGQERASDTLEQARQLQGTQRAQLAASGVDIGSGSAAQVLEQTVDFGIQDAITVKTNAYRQAFGLEKQAVNQRAAAKVSRAGRKFEQKATIIAGGLKAVQSGTSAFGSFQ